MDLSYWCITIRATSRSTMQWKRNWMMTHQLLIGAFHQKKKFPLFCMWTKNMAITLLQKNKRCKVSMVCVIINILTLVYTLPFCFHTVGLHTDTEAVLDQLPTTLETLVWSTKNTSFVLFRTFFYQERNIVLLHSSHGYVLQGKQQRNLLVVVQKTKYWWNCDPWSMH